MRIPPEDAQVATVRRFSRFYTRRIGALDRGFLDSEYSLTEVRVLFELRHHGSTTASAISDELGLDAAYLSRLLRQFEKRGLLTRTRSSADRRQAILRLTAKGRRVFDGLDARQHAAVTEMIAPLPHGTRREVVRSMARIERLLDAAPARRASYTLRDLRPGDIGWVVHRHGALYHQEYGWDETFEALVAEIVADFVKHHDPARERCWVAEVDGAIVGSVFCVKKSETVAKLRLLYVEPSTRAMGIGTRLVDECVRFAREAGYETLTLWTQSLLHSARRVYERTGFRLVAEEAHHSFGADLVAQTWELPLSS
jgi:DNA-binding MarR family transcriptional regulator/N-acetylglutamate synthase-like GNAT family acetyltransferase